MSHVRLVPIMCAFVAAAMLLPATTFGKPAALENDDGKEWTLLVYWVADNNLEFCTEFAMAAWEESLTSNEEVNLVAMVDILSEPGTWVYEVWGGESHLVESYTELNTSDPDVLEEFVNYGLANYPSEKVMLVVQDHGFSWRGALNDETDGNTLMSVDGLTGALRNAKSANDGKGVDLLAFDACSMATIEVVYELRDVVSYMVASQTVVPYDGLPYTMMVTDMVGNPGISPEELAADIVYDYIEYYSDKTAYEHIYPYNQDFSTVTAVNMSKVPELGSAFIRFSEELLPIMEHHLKGIMDARSAAIIGIWANMGGYEWLPDICKFMEGLEGVFSPELDSAIADFMVVFEDAVVAEAHSPRYDDRAHGMTLWFPPSVSQYESCCWAWTQQFDYDACGLDLVEESVWVDCLMKYYDMESWRPSYGGS